MGPGAWQGDGLAHRAGLRAASLDSTCQLDLGRLVDAVAGLVDGLLGLTSTLALVVMVFFMTLDGGWFSERLLHLPGARRPLAEALGLFASGTRRYPWSPRCSG